MNTDRIYEFQILAQTLHYGQAASRLYISQSILSRHIQSLEEELGIQLFTRTSHSVALTSAGVAFYRLTRDFTKDTARYAEAARIAGLGLRGSVKIAILLPTMSGKFKEFLIHFEKRYPDIFIQADIITDIHPGQTEDYHFLTVPSQAVSIPDNYELSQTFPEEGCLALPDNHHFRPGSVVSLKDLADETLFLPGYDRRRGAYARIGQLVRKMTNDHIRIVSVPTPETALLNVELGRGYAILPKYRIHTLSSTLQYTDIAEKCSFDLFLMRNINNDSPETELFESKFTEIMSEQAH